MSHEREYPQPSQDHKHKRAWNAHRIKALREYLKLTQSEMAEELQVRQQTISEWETGVHTPHRSTQKVLSMVAERAGFAYQVEPRQHDNPVDTSQT
jgi:DNA-binding transcriptional regulator YiaG